jgi:hypothetical protein
MAQNSPPIRSLPASDPQRALMAKFGGAVDAKGWTLKKAFTPQLRLNLGFDRWRGGNNPQLASFNEDFDSSFAIGEEP